MISGLLSQRERMITCVSLRSGMASKGRRKPDHAPQRQAAASKANIRNLLLAENSMIRLIIQVSKRPPDPRRNLLLRLHTSPDPVGTSSDICPRSEEHTSELQSQSNLVCRLLLDK